MPSFFLNRSLRIINNLIEDLKLDLSGNVVLTEVGTNGYLFSPVIPLIANAKHVFAYAKDSKYGHSSEIIAECLKVVKLLGVHDRITFITKITPEILKSVDILTNSGSLRPLDRNILSNLKKGAVIPLMYDAWEYRKEDVDIDYCKENGIYVAGTNENYDKLNIFEFVRFLAIKMVFEAGYEVNNNNIIIWSRDDFGTQIKQGLLMANAKNVLVINELDILYENLSDAEILFIADYHESRPYFGDDSLFNIDYIIQLNSNITIIHLYGDVDNSILNMKQVHCYPNKKGFPQTMTFTLGHVGLYPILGLLTGSYKVAEVVNKGKEHKIAQML